MNIGSYYPEETASDGQVHRVTTPLAELSRIMDPVVKLLKNNDVPDDHFLYSRILGVICNGLIYMGELTVFYLYEKGIFDDVMTLILNKSNTFITPYDRKNLILSMISTYKTLSAINPEKFKSGIPLLRYLDKAVCYLHVQRMEFELQYAKSNKSRVKPAMQFGLSEKERQDQAAYNFIVGKTYGLQQVLEEENDEPNEKEMASEVLEFLMGSTYGASKLLERAISPTKEVDEFKEFQNFFFQLKVNSWSNERTTLEKSSTKR